MTTPGSSSPPPTSAWLAYAPTRSSHPPRFARRGPPPTTTPRSSPPPPTSAWLAYAPTRSSPRPRFARDGPSLVIDTRTLMGGGTRRHGTLVPIRLNPDLYKVSDSSRAGRDR